MKNKRFGRIRHREMDISEYYNGGGQDIGKWRDGESLEWEGDGGEFWIGGIGWV